MKKPQSCNANAIICEDCEHWEPIPFHHRGGECIPKSTATMVMQSIPELVGELDKVLVNA
jgi:hypothetical protein